MEFNFFNLSWAVQRAINFNVISKMRMISYDIGSDSPYLLKVVVDDKLTDEERDIIYTIDGEISCDFNLIINSKLEIKIDSETVIEHLDRYKYIAYARYE